LIWLDGQRLLNQPNLQRQVVLHDFDFGRYFAPIQELEIESVFLVLLQKAQIDALLKLDLLDGGVGSQRDLDLDPVVRHYFQNIVKLATCGRLEVNA
jgi:hypothetical protein